MSIHPKSHYTILIHRFHRDAIFFFLVQPRRYASGHVLFYDCARNERDAREKVENERGGWEAALGISKTRNWPVAINHLPVVRLFDSFRSVPRPPWASSLPNQFKWFRKALPRCCYTTSLLVCITTGYAYAVPRWSTWEDALRAPCYAHLHICTRSHVYACPSHSTTAYVFCPSHTRYVSVPLFPPLSPITILIAVKVLTSNLSECHRSIAGETFLPRRIAVHLCAALQSSG